MDAEADHPSLSPLADKTRFYRAFAISAGFAAFLWWIKFLEWFLARDLSALGVQPLQWRGLLGVLVAPLLHGSIAHLVSNTLPLLVLGTLALYAYPNASKKSIPLIWLLSGIGTWLIARPSVHIGASGLNHGLMFLLFFLGALRWDKRAIAVSLVVFLLYGGMLLTVFPREAEISWEYHLCGAVVGFVCAFVWRRADPPLPQKKYSWDYEQEFAEELSAQEDELEMPSPRSVPVLWFKPDDEALRQERDNVIPFPTKKPASVVMPEPPTSTKH